jgi:hypothetical protein
MVLQMETQFIDVCCLWKPQTANRIPTEYYVPSEGISCTSRNLKYVTEFFVAVCKNMINACLQGIRLI